MEVRALLDTGAQGCILTTRVAHRLGLVWEAPSVPLRGIGDLEVRHLAGQTHFSFSSVHGSTMRIAAAAMVMENIVGWQPSLDLHPGVKSSVSDLDLADPHFDHPAPVDLLLGSDVLGWILLGSQKALGPSSLVAISTIFGYAVMGPICKVQEQESKIVASTTLAKTMQRFWEIEEPPMAPRVDPDHAECEAFYQATTGRLPTGRFVTRLPFIASPPALGHSRALAEKRLLAMERRMRRDPVLREKYIEFMREYEALGHMSPARVDWSSTEHFFLPHHAVMKASSGKLRTVFDGSAPTSTGVSLNQCLHSGPKLHRDVIDVILGFRRHQVVIGADIRMMFRQTVIHPDDRRYQLILWREDPGEPVRVYELNTNTYGLKSSPYIAIRTLLELAERERARFPRGAAALARDLYVDDVCTGAQSIEEALVLRDELIGILAAGGYELRKWLSNDPRLLEGVPEDHQQNPHMFADLEDPNMIAVLGMQYQPVNDIFTFQVDLEPQSVWTKRTVLSTIARMFDPNGWISPVIFSAKCLLQQLWTLGVSWDEPLIGPPLDTWLELISSMKEVNRVALPRRILPPGRYRSSLHGFCDASERGYAASVYLRTVDADGQVNVILLLAKSKVAPIRTRLTIPKLELSGAHLLSRLLSHVSRELAATVDIQDIFAWSDSQVALAWLRAAPHTLEIFVGNRVSQIQNIGIPIIWRHVPGELNPADCASRGCTAPELVSHPLWWGPEWLRESETSWPVQPVDRSAQVLPGLRVHAVAAETSRQADWLLGRYSSLDKLLGVTGWIQRFIHNCRHPQNKKLSPVVDAEERRGALLHWIRAVQAERFEPELKILRDGRAKLKGAVARLNPFTDSEGLLRVGGRLRKADLPYGSRHPLLLPKGGPLVELLVSDRHIRNAHAGCSALLAILQREFWILSARRVVRSALFRCVPCYRVKAATMQPQMGDLPSDRVTPSRAFDGVATDFAGPFSVKTTTLRNAKVVKAYLCVFVCLATKAVHLEVVSALTTEAFVAALDRFVSRRGLPSLIRSDNGTNYRGAYNYLNDVNEFLRNHCTSLSQHFAQKGITWRFSPPNCPHWGGIFEAAVKSAKTHLRRVIGETTLTFEELATVFCKVEAVLNSRPLCPLSPDPNDQEVLTPGHFLVGQPLAALPEYPWKEERTTRLSRFQMIQQMGQDFWSRWSIEYLHLLQQRVKWTDKTEPPKEGDLVLMKDTNLPSLFWRRGRIVKLIFGADGTPRVAEVLVDGSIRQRALATLSRLPVE